MRKCKHMGTTSTSKIADSINDVQCQSQQQNNSQTLWVDRITEEIIKYERLNLILISNR